MEGFLRFTIEGVGYTLVAQEGQRKAFFRGSSVVAAPLYLPQSSMKKKFQAPSWLTEQNQWLSEVWSLLQHIGVDNFMNAKRKYDALQSSLEEKEKVIQEIIQLTGTSHIGNAKQRINSLMKNSTPDDLSQLPEMFHKPPAVWIWGKPPSALNENGIAPMKPRDAERRHRVMLTLLLEAWKLTEGNDEERLMIEKAYRNWSADEFENELYFVINKLEEPTLEEKLEEEEAIRLANFRKWQEQNSIARSKDTKRKVK